jgi:signal peptidase I
MTDTQAASTASPFATLWLSPRQTIERIVATRPGYLVLPLAMLGTIAGFYLQLVAAGFAAPLTDWRLVLAFAIGSAAFGIVWLYLSALILRWIGSLLGGRASALQLRAVLAWSLVPAIAGAIVILAITLVEKFAGGSSVVARGLPWLATAFTLWPVVVLLLMLGRVEQFGFWRTISLYVLNLVFASLLLAVSFRTLLYQPFNIPAGSMIPTMVVGDYVFAAKFPYGYSRFSLPFSPRLFSGRLFGAAPKRGDVVVFRSGLYDYVKRVVGLPGERIQMKDGMLYINDVAVKHEAVADYAGDACGSGAVKVKRWRETLPNGVSYETLDCLENGQLDNTEVFTVPAGQYFMLGDNRDNSVDSRMPSQLGTVPLENLIGRVDLIFFSRSPDTRQTRSERIGKVVR